MAKIVGTFLSAELRDERANCSSEARHSSGGDLAEESLEFAVRQLNRVQIRRVLWQEANCRPRFFNRLPNTRTQVDSAVIHDHDVIAPERGHQALFDICKERPSCHCTLNDHRRRHFIVPQGGDERDCLPRAKRNCADHPDAARSRALSRVKFVLTAASSRNTSRAGSSKPCSRIQRRRARATSARWRSAACRLFFERDAMPIKKPPKRAAAGANPLFSQLCNDLLQSQIRLFLHQSQNLRGKLFQRRSASAARLWLGIPALFPPLQPSDRRTRADLETAARLTPGGTGHNSCDHADSQVTGISFRHCSNPQKGESMPKDSLHNRLRFLSIQFEREPL